MNLVFGFTDTIPTQTKYMYATASGRSDGLFYYVVEESPLARYGLSFKYTLSYIIDYF
ncbi:hypothetical protein HanPSC8_Chr10g0439701 [Helianthus annuus]|nr:hypothetical protein HanPSC8_Chr10g0439701 [Helianthus annuus]